MMNVLILTEGGRDIGFGHLTRSISLYQAFEEKDITPKLVVNGDGYVRDLLKDKNYQMLNWLGKKNRLFEIVSKADIVIIDSYLADKALYHKIAEVSHDKLLVMIDDYNRIEYPVGIVVNPSIYGDKLDYSKKGRTVFLTGKNYIIVRKEFWTATKKKINKDAKNILITFGGVDHSDVSDKILGHLKTRCDFRFHVVDPEKSRVDAEEMHYLMLEADICISGGGQTTYELARCGVPTIGICFAGNQRPNLEGWKEKGFIEYAGSYNDQNLLETIARTINELMPYEERLRRSTIGRSCVDGKGVTRVVSKLIRKCESGRELTK